MPTIEEMTHKELVARGVRWLQNSQNYPVVVSGIGAGWEIPDVLGWRGDGYTSLIEVKVSLSDFKKDSGKPFRSNPDTGMGGNRYYLVPMSLRDKVINLIPENWGLLAAGKSSIFEVIRPKGFSNRNKAYELEMLIKIIRRIARPDIPLQGMNIKWYVPFGGPDNQNNELYVEREVEIDKK